MSFEKALQQAINFHRQGRLADAEAGYRTVLARSPKQFEALNYLGVLKMQQGDLPEAARLLSAAVAVRPAATDALSNLGAVLTALGRAKEALAVFDRVLAAAPGNLDAHYNRGVVLAGLGRFEEALSAYDAVLATRPGEPSALINRSLALARLGRDAEALAACDRALAATPRSVDALLCRGNVLARLGRHDEALAAFDRLLTIDPQQVDALNNRGIVLKELGRYDEALASCERALALKPDHVDAYISRGNISSRRGDHAAALADFDRALALRPDESEALNNRGVALRELHRYEEALASLDRALAVTPDSGRALNNRGLVLSALGRLAEARESYDRALQIAPDDADALYNRSVVLGKLGAYEQAIADSGRALSLDPRHPAAYNVLLNWQLVCCDWRAVGELSREFEQRVADDTSIVEPLLALACSPGGELALRCAQKLLARRLPAASQAAPPRSPVRRDRIRVAYLSSDYRRHAVANVIAELFERHDRGRFEIVGVSLGPDDQSELRARLVRSFDWFVDARNQSDAEIASHLRELAIDIVVDLNGHTEGGRPGILALRAAPIQVNYLGYAATSGADFVDYVIGDPIALPFDQQACFTERLAHLPESFMVVDTTRALPPSTPSREQAGLPPHGFVFCAFNNSFKFTAAVFDIWMRLLRQVEGSVLWLRGGNALMADNLRRAADVRGVEPGRLIFSPQVERIEDHLARHRLADLFLDTLPYNAHTTASDALWAGLPVVTCRGDAFAGRVAASLLHAVGLPDLVTHSLEEYEILALKLASDPALLRSLRERLARNRSTCPLFDTGRFCRHLEAAYTTMWEIGLRGETPRSFAIEPLP